MVPISRPAKALTTVANFLEVFFLVIFFNVLMSIFSYKPLVLFILMAVGNYFRVKKNAENFQSKGVTINLPLFYSASYLYIALVPILALYLQSRTWIPE